jgi:phosphonate transport system substrate-binding protein
MAYLSPFPYVLTTQKMKLVPIVVPGRNGQPAFYHSLIVTGAGSGIHTIDDLKARSHSLTLCFADPISTSGHLVPRAYLRSINLDPATSFKQTLFAGSHFASILMAKTGKVDVACAFNYALDKLIREKTIKPEDIVVLWQSDPIEQNPIAMRPDINPAFTEKVKQAYLDMKKDDSVAFRSYLSIYMPNDVSAMSYIPFADTDFDGVRKLVNGIDPSDIKN